MTPELIEMDMTTTRPEFFRCLEVALRGMPWKINGDHIIAGEEGKKIDLKLSPLPARQLSQLLALERWKLVIEFGHHSEEERSAFMTKFKQAFHRGGG
ncbi:MAG: hypothetical protein GY927_08105 [bacterium]|nr:hypothetical protein [bacterium]